MPELLTPSTVLAPEARMRPPLGALAGAWLAGYRSLATRNAYRSDLRKWLAYCEQHDLDPLAIRRSHVELFARQLEADGGAASSVARRLSALSSWYGWLLDEGFISTTPTARLRRPSVSSESNRTWLARHELADWLAAAEQLGGYSYALACLLAINALRVGEACGANIRDIDSDRHHHTLRITGKGDKPALIPLTGRTWHAINTAVEGRTNGPLLLNREGSRMTNESASRIVRRVAGLAGIGKRLTPHSLRHSSITAALNAGVDLRDVQQFARHSDPATTVRYDRARLTLDRHPAYIVDAYVAGATA